MLFFNRDSCVSGYFPDIPNRYRENYSCSFRRHACFSHAAEAARLGSDDGRTA